MAKFQPGDLARIGGDEVSPVHFPGVYPNKQPEPLPDPMSRKRLEAMKARCEAATAEPWPENCLTLEHIRRWLRRTGAQRPDEDTAFVSQARTDLPALVAAYERAVEALGDILECTDHWTDNTAYCADCEDCATAIVREYEG